MSERLVVIGSQWGDEGKGKITDYFACRADMVVRYQGGRAYLPESSIRRP